MLHHHVLRDPQAKPIPALAFGGKERLEDAVTIFASDGGAIVADNVDLNEAFHEFTAEVKPAFSAVVKEENTTDLFGIIVKRA